jgi:hypothetical protein
MCKSEVILFFMQLSMEILCVMKCYFLLFGVYCGTSSGKGVEKFFCPQARGLGVDFFIIASIDYILSGIPVI